MQQVRLFNYSTCGIPILLYETHQSKIIIDTNIGLLSHKFCKYIGIEKKILFENNYFVMKADCNLKTILF